MKGITLSYTEKCECSRDKFCSFIERDNEFTDEQKNQLQKLILNNQVSGTLYVIAVLAGWSFIAAWVDALLIPGASLYSILIGEFSFSAFSFPLAFIILNTSFKFFYIWHSLRKKISLKDNFIAVIPYVGSIYLLREYLVKNPLLYRAVKLFLKEQKQIIRRKVS